MTSDGKFNLTKLLVLSPQSDYSSTCSSAWTRKNEEFLFFFFFFFSVKENIGFASNYSNFMRHQIISTIFFPFLKNPFTGVSRDYYSLPVDLNFPPS